MSGDDIGGYGGPSDDGVGMLAWRMAQRLDGARQAYAEAVRAEGVSPLVEALCARLAGSPVASARSAPESRPRVRWDAQAPPKRGVPGALLFTGGKRYRADAQGWFVEVRPADGVER
ncbi:hypothetical protein QA942_10270 [Streptomyces sp. B21-106]|uniref:hypothetical protein n=1 Tax=Streptomyces sp. B21-106 TaxID=3039418 RepID=UPI002FF43843